MWVFYIFFVLFFGFFFVVFLTHQVEIGGLASKPFTLGATDAQVSLTAGVKALFGALRKEFPGEENLLFLFLLYNVYIYIYILAMKDAVDGRVLFRNEICYGYNSVCRVSTAAFTQISG